MVIIIISREFIISGFRLVASDNGVVIAASHIAKYKTTFQMILVIFLILDLSFPYADIVKNILVVIALVLTIVSLIDYLIKNKEVMLEGGNK